MTVKPGGGNGTSAPLSGRVDGARSLVHLLKDGREGCTVGVLGDSTANDADEFLMVWLDWLADQVPGYSVMHRAWNDTNQGFDRRTFRSVGTDGARYVTLSGSGQWIYATDSAGLSVTGDLAGMVIVRPNDWTPAAAQALISKFGGAGQRSWRFQISSSNVLQFEWSADGTNLSGFKSATVALSSVVGLTDNTTALALAFTLDVDNGATGNDLKFWYATFDPATAALGAWTQVGATVTTAGVTSVFDSTNNVEVGTRTGGADLFAGHVYYAEMRSGTDLAASPIVASMDPGVFTSGDSFKDGEGNTWTMYGAQTVVGAPALLALNASTSGMALSYSTDATRFEKQTPIEPVLTFINYSHNDGTTTAYAAFYAGLVDQLITKYPYADVLAVTQNPKKAPETAAKIQAHASRNRQITQVAHAKNIMLADGYRAFLNTGDPDSYVSADGIHPSADGKVLMSDVVKALFTPWLSSAAA